MEKLFTKKLKTILHSKTFYILWIIVLVIYVLCNLMKESSPVPEENILVEGKIIEYKWNDEKSKVELTVKSKKEKYLFIYFYQEKETLENIVQYGNKIKVRGKKTNPLNNTIPNTFNYKEYLKSQGFDYYISLEEITKIEQGNFLERTHQYLREYLNEKPYANYYKTLLLGIKENRKEEIDEAYRKNGISHLFVISGMHLGLFFAMCNLISKRLTKKEKGQILLSLILLTVYYYFLTKSASSKRAYLFFVIKIMSDLSNLNLNTKQIYILNIGVHLWINPYGIYDIGFQYTFLLSLGYLLLRFQEKKKWKSIVKNSILAFVISLPITINNTFVINPWSILINIIMIPLISSILLPLLLISCFLPYLEWGVKLLIIFIEWLNQIALSFPLSEITMSKIPLIMLFGYYFCLYSFFKYKSKTIWLFWFMFLAIKLLIPKLDPNGYLYFFDVGEGDSAFLISPYQKEVILIDTGKENESLAKNLVLFLKSIGINKIDYFILSHGDEDHAGNAIELAKKIKVKNIVQNEGEKNNLEKKIEKLFPDKITKEIKTRYLQITDLKHTISQEENDSSRTLHICIYKTCTLFLGDIGKETEQEIIDKYQMQAMILKVAHHGSKTSTGEELLKKVPFQYAVISSGRNNRYFHPHEEVINRLKTYHKNILGTQELGTIRFKINKKGYTISSYPP